MSKSQSKKMKLLVASLAVGSLYFMPVSQAATPEAIVFNEKGITTFAAGDPTYEIDDFLSGGIVPGTAADTAKNGTIAIGTGSQANRWGATALGYNSKADGSASTAIGWSSSATTDGTAIGYGASSARHSMAIGSHAKAGAEYSTAVGYGANVTAQNAVGLGKSASVTGENSIALGADTKVWNKNSVVIGYKSSTYEDNTVSVGSKGNERKVVNVAAGENDTDAVNLGQLNTKLGGYVSWDHGTTDTINGVQFTGNGIVIAGDPAHNQKVTLDKSGLTIRYGKIRLNDVEINGNNLNFYESDSNKLAGSLDLKKTAQVVGGVVKVGEAVWNYPGVQDAVKDSALEIAKGTLNPDTTINKLAQVMGKKDTHELFSSIGEENVNKLLKTVDPNAKWDEATGKLTIKGFTVSDNIAGQFPARFLGADGSIHPVDLVRNLPAVLKLTSDRGLWQTLDANMDSVISAGTNLDWKALGAEKGYTAINQLANGHVTGDDATIGNVTVSNDGSISGVKDAEFKADSTDAVNAGQLYDAGIVPGKTSGANSTAIGVGSNSTQNSVALGANANASTNGSVAIGFGAKAGEGSRNKATAVGYQAKALGISSVAFGAESKVESLATNAVALGAGSVASEANTVSVGNDKLQRKVVNVADGKIVEGSHDAVTGGQLYTTNQKLEALDEEAVKWDEGTTNKIKGVSFDGDGKLSTTVNRSMFGGSNTLVFNENGLTVSGTKDDGSNMDSTNILGGTITTNKVTGLADPTKDSDAANKKYVDAVQGNLDELNKLAVKYDSEAKDSITFEGANGTALNNVSTIDGVSFDGDGKLSTTVNRSMFGGNNTFAFDENGLTVSGTKDDGSNMGSTNILGGTVTTNKVTGLADLTENSDGSDAANKNYVDAVKSSVADLDKLAVKYDSETKDSITFEGENGTALNNVSTIDGVSFDGGGRFSTTVDGGMFGKTSLSFNEGGLTISNTSGSTRIDGNTITTNRVTGLAAPVEKTDAANKQYVDEQVKNANQATQEAVGNQNYLDVKGTDIQNGMNVTEAIGKVNNKVGDLNYSAVKKGELTDGDNTTTAIGKLNHKIDDKINTVSDDINDVKQKVTGITYDEKTQTTTIGGKAQFNEGGITMTGGGDVATENGSKLSTLGKTSDLDEELTKNDKYTSNQTVVGAVNAEADIRRNEVARIDSNVSALSGRVDSLESRMGDVEERIDKVGAMSAAIANLRTMGFDPEAPTEIAVGVGQYKSETGLALGVFHYPNQDFMLSASVSTSGDEVMGGIGATWKIGRKTAAERARISEEKAAEKAAEIKAAAEKAAKDAEVNAQREKHAQLLAQREAAHQDIHQTAQKA